MVLCSTIHIYGVQDDLIEGQKGADTLVGLEIIIMMIGKTKELRICHGDHYLGGIR